jgi:hypothetical protein
VALDSRPVRSSEDLLGKAQSEFAIKARDALIQRRMAQTSTAPAVASQPTSAPQRPYVVASLEPVAPPTIAVSKEIEAIAPASPMVNANPLDAPIASAKLSAPPEFAVAPAAEPKKATEPQTASLPESPAAREAVTPKPAIASPSELATVTTQTIASTAAKPRQSEKVTHKARRTPSEPKTKTVVRRSRPDVSRNSMPYSIEALRSRAPEIAAAIARYM